ncbi:MAG: STAS domain-containing protein [Proteobacteria bacterium]|nr:STAS domain-containing protein [Pseudomonadota bacterium]
MREIVSEAVRLVLPERVTLADANQVLSALQAALPPGGAAVVVDATPLQELDSAVLAVLLALRRLPQMQGRALQVDGAPERLVELAQLYGVAELLGMR